MKRLEDCMRSNLLKNHFRDKRTSKVKLEYMLVKDEENIPRLSPHMDPFTYELNRSFLIRT